MVGHDGRVRVLDFGLARGLGSPESVAAHGDTPSPSLDATLTATGTVVGTPAYMSPEQLMGKVADTASDQFSFCVVLFEALYGMRPFKGKNVEALTIAVQTGLIIEPQAGHDVPSWLHRIVLRGLELDPEDRYPSMEALLRDLEHDPALRRRRSNALKLAGAGALVAAALVYHSGTRAEHSSCESAAAAIDLVWNDERRESLATAFEETTLPHAIGTWTRVSSFVDRYAQDWSEQMNSICEATHVDQTQPLATLEKRRRCLNERLLRLDATLGVFAEPSPTVVDHAIQAIHGLPDVRGCEDVQALEAGVAPPEQESIRLRVAELQEDLSMAEALSSGAKYREALEVLEPLLAQARETEYMPLVATIEHQIAQSQHFLGLPEASTTWRAAFEDALASGDDRRAAMIAVDIAHELGSLRRDHDAGRRWLGVAEALVHRIGGDPRIEIGITNTLATITARQGRFEEALELAKEVVEQERSRAPESLGLATALMNLGSTFTSLRELDHARDHFEQSLVLTIHLQGAKHPQVADIRTNLARVALMRNDYEEGRTQLEPTLELLRKTLGDRHPDYARALGLLAIVERNLGDPIEAERLQRQTLEILRSTLDPDHPDIAESTSFLAWAVAEQGRLREALELARQAQQISHHRLDPGHVAHGVNHAMVAHFLLETGQAREALEQARHAIEILDAYERGPTDSQNARRIKGRSERELGDIGASLTTLEQAIDRATSLPDDPLQLARLRFELVLTLAETGQQERALDLAIRARDDLEERKDFGRDAAAVYEQIDEWVISRTAANTK